MSNLNNDGFVPLIKTISNQDLNTLRNLLLEKFQRENKQHLFAPIQSLEKVHQCIEKDKVRRTSINYYSREIEQHLTAIFYNYLIQPLTKIHGFEIEVETGSNIIASFPYKYLPLSLGYHQDDNADTWDNKFHLLINLNQFKHDLFQVIKGTHTMGNFDHTMFAPFLRIQPEKLQHLKTQVTPISLDFGDTVLFNKLLVHKIIENNFNNTIWLARIAYKRKSIK